MQICQDIALLDVLTHLVHGGIVPMGQNINEDTNISQMQLSSILNKLLLQRCANSIKSRCRTLSICD